MGTSGPVTTAIPVTLGAPGMKNIALKNRIIVNNAVPVGSTGLVPQRIPVTTATEDITLFDVHPQHNNLVNVEDPLEDPLATNSLTPAVDSIETEEDEEVSSITESLEKSVKCVFCEKNFPSMQDMQAHYLSAHKARRGKDKGKRKTTAAESTMNQVASSPESELVIAEPENGDGEFPPSSNEQEPKCPVCYIQLKTIDEVESHIKEVHSYICSECNATFYNLMQFTGHKCTRVGKKVKRVRRKSTSRVKTNNNSDSSNNINSDTNSNNNINSGSSNKNNKVSSSNKGNTKSSGSSSTKRSRSSKSSPKTGENLKPEVVKIMTRYVQIQPKTPAKKRARDATPHNTGNNNNNNSSSPPPPVLQRVGSSSPQISIVSDGTLPQPSESLSGGEFLGFGVATVGESSVSASVESSSPGNQVFHLEESVHQKQVEEDSKNFLPSINSTYTLKPSSLDMINTPGTENEGKEIRHIKVIETNNIDQARKLVEKAGKEEDNTTQLPNRKEQIQEKIAQLKQNPNVSLSWQPTLRVKNFQDGEDFVCGRCNVLCDDMEDYMDHLQDCLTMSSVSLEPVSSPPRRLLRLQHEVASFGSRGEVGRSFGYGLNRNLMSKLQAYLPSTRPPEYLQDEALKSEADQIHRASPDSIPLTQAFRELLGDDFGHTPQDWEPLGNRTLSPLSPTPPPPPQQQTETQQTTRVPSTNYYSNDDSASEQTVTQRVKNTAHPIGSKPMVMIPMNPEAKLNISVIPEQLLRKSKGPNSPHTNSQEAVGNFRHCRETLLPPPGSPPSSPVDSPLDLLLDQDEIKMEVEEEVVEDHYQES
ncbi:hypothetical protein Pmani_019727 [Petrolisthes manimaculis]|uniref:C2H2-type domain-containing protein n=1 Tax=Petrolisthes manimaculis TaxID=1843537 RepID=A0AAE1U7C3_9EUCA|nr:hypothetical protein Pmani_019727 [Petrolisthes manimaculis]